MGKRTVNVLPSPFWALDTYGSGVLLHDLPDACQAKPGAAGDSFCAPS